MGWFDEQIKQRIDNDNAAFAEAFGEMAGVVMGKKALSAVLNNQRKQAQNAIEEILAYYHIAPKEMPDHLQDVNDQLEFLLRPSGIMRRDVELSEKWYKDGIGPLLCTTAEGRIIALIPKGISGYTFLDYTTGKRVRVTRKNAALIAPQAICFYKPFPLRKLTAADLLRYMVETVSAADYLMIVFATLALTLIGLLSAYVNSLIFGDVIRNGRMPLFYAALALLVGVTVSMQLIQIVKSLLLSRVDTKISVAVESAAMMRVLSLPAAFFKQYSAGELAGRLRQVHTLCSTLTSVVLSAGLSVVFSLVYVGQLFRYAPALAVPGLLTLLVTLLILIVAAALQTKEVQAEMQCRAKENGLVFSLLSGIQKIKLAGAEKRGFAKWAHLYRNTAQKKYNAPTVVKIVSVLTSTTMLLGTMILYFFAVRSNVNVAQFMAFDVAYGMVSGALLVVVPMVPEIAQIRPALEQIRPIMETLPEIAQNKTVVTRLTGGIELSHVSFGYDKNMPLVIDNLSLKIRPGQYVAIVGATGCGKSTLMRLMLGFETPQKGAIYYDGKDLNSLDLKSLRRRIGTVMQNGKLFSGSIYSNIIISAPWLTLDDAWQAAEMAGVAEDIRAMPMGMHTVISEGSGGISGGQRQRLMIARAIAPKPRVLMFDEATSALDNITQKIVSDSLEHLKCTRVVIAHRLSTIRQCDRIIVLDKGKIAEDGTYEELIEKNGLFAQLVERQRVDV